MGVDTLPRLNGRAAAAGAGGSLNACSSWARQSATTRVFASAKSIGPTDLTGPAAARPQAADSSVATAGLRRGMERLLVKWMRDYQRLTKRSRRAASRTAQGLRSTSAAGARPASAPCGPANHSASSQSS